MSTIDIYLKGGVQLRTLLRLKRNHLLLLSPLSFFLILLAKKSSFFAEHINALGVYKWLSQFISLITGMLPISLAEIFLMILPVILAAILIRFIIKLIKDKRNRKTNAVKGIINVMCALSVILFSFTIMGGLNYYRYPFSYYSNLEIENYTVEELYDLTMHLAKQANELRSRVPKVDENDVFDLSMSNYELAKEANKAMRKLSKEYPVLGGRYGSPKPVLLSRLMSHTEITGIFVPFTMEANVNVDISDYAIPYTMLHEMAHQRGFMREDEANYIAYLAGASSDNVELQYSSTMMALISSGNELYMKNQELYFEVRDIYSDGIVKDIRANSEYWARYKDTVVSTVSNKINDTYLKANAQTDGVQSYNRMVELLLAKYKAEQTKNQ